MTVLLEFLRLLVKIKLIVFIDKVMINKVSISLVLFDMKKELRDFN